MRWIRIFVIAMIFGVLVLVLPQGAMAKGLVMKASNVNISRMGS